MKSLVYIVFIFPVIIFAQITSTVQDSLAYDYIIIEGDSIPRTAIGLDEVKLLHKLEFDSRDDRRRYLILRRKTIKVYPYAKLAAERLETLNERLAKMKRRRDRKRYAKKIHRYIEGEFSEKLKKLTRTEGQILIKLIYRQTGKTTFRLVKELRNGWRAFWFHNTAKLFDLSLKKEFDPLNEKEDYLIEDILQRNFQSGVLIRQEPAIDIDFYTLTEKWLNPPSESSIDENSN
jgi:hypothetical protein